MRQVPRRCVVFIGAALEGIGGGGSVVILVDA